MKLITPIVLPLASLLTSCGGKLALPDTSAIAIRSSVAEIAYGGTVTISWNSRNVSALNQGETSFPVTETLTNGSISDRPATNTTYVISARGNDGNTVTSKVTVKVTKGTKNYLFVANPLTAGTDQLTEQLRLLTTGTVSVSASLPASLSTDGIIIDSTAQVGPSERARVLAYLASGKGVVIVGRSVRNLCTGDPENPDISAIGNQLAGATTTESAFFGAVNTFSSPVTTVPVTQNLGGRSLSIAELLVTPVTSTATVLARGRFDAGVSHLTYTPPSGGRIAYCTNFPVGDSLDEKVSRELVFACARWASGG